jgi:hypothetical protein
LIQLLGGGNDASADLLDIPAEARIAIFDDSGFEPSVKLVGFADEGLIGRADRWTGATD